MADYTLKNMPNNFWRKVKALAAIRGLSIKKLIIGLLEKEVGKK